MQKLVVFSGAGMSAESGIHTFRDSNGLWENHAIEDVATPEAWARQPELVQRFYNERRKQILAAQPNLAHQLIARLQDYFDVSVITQNIDDLHERAGNLKVTHLHGNIRFAKSSAPNHAAYPEKYYPIEGWELCLDRDFAEDGSPLRPHVVWFGEAVPEYTIAQQIVRQADIFIVIGSTLVVYPVAGLVHEIPKHCQAFYIDPKASHDAVPTQYTLLNSTATQGMAQLFTQLTASSSDI
ncbi:NAD-dependent protein deacylase [Serratia sp. S1B]|nr:NAD-dependent protein deacylase [Serratia sp. S1B]